MEPMLRMEMRWFKSVDSGAPELQYRYEFRYSDGSTDWTEWETVKLVLE
jgi:uncharacterized protein YajQ (UPF0234 family)